MWYLILKISNHIKKTYLSKNILIFHTIVEKTDPYSFISEYDYIKTLKNIKASLIKNRNTISYIGIECHFNGISYPVYDLDSDDSLTKFKDTILDKHIIFRSSPQHYWAILDLNLKNINEYSNTLSWNIINDQDYVNYCIDSKTFRIRGLYDSLPNKPKIIYKSKELSENFSEFIILLETYFNSESLELSALKYKSYDLMKKYQRINILKTILNKH